MKSRKAIFFDRDGIVNFRLVGEYIYQTTNFIFTPDFLKFFPIAKSKGYLLILISNQKGVGKGLMTYEDLNIINNFMNQKLLDLFGYSFDDIFYSTDVNENESWSLKPNPGMLVSAIEKWNINKDLSWMLGDSTKDILAGKRAGVRTALVGIANYDKESEPDLHITHLIEMLELI